MSITTNDYPGGTLQLEIRNTKLVILVNDRHGANATELHLSATQARDIAYDILALIGRFADAEANSQDKRGNHTR
jgi:hypothetical protein